MHRTKVTKLCLYRASHVLVDLGWVGLTLISVFHHLAYLFLPNSHQPKQNWSDSGTIKLNKTQSQKTQGRPVRTLTANTLAEHQESPAHQHPAGAAGRLQHGRGRRVRVHAAALHRVPARGRGVQPGERGHPVAQGAHGHHFRQGGQGGRTGI